nr:hypothetical protein [Candidatus Freyarchaeota archaeon]
MAKETDLKTIASIISIASKYIIASVVLISIGAASGVYAVLTYLVYGTSITFTSSIAVFLVLFIGLALIAIGVFLTLRSLYWMRSEGIRLREMLEKDKSKGTQRRKSNDS